MGITPFHKHGTPVPARDPPMLLLKYQRYDIADIGTTATADGGRWILNGSKGVVFNGGNAELLVVPARTAGAQNETDGITLFAVPAETPGIEIRAYPTVDGQRAAEVRLENVAVDAAAVLHPHDAANGVTTIADLFTPSVVGVGEAGLDYFYDHSPRDVQRQVFAGRDLEAFANLAEQLSLLDAVNS